MYKLEKYEPRFTLSFLNMFPHDNDIVRSLNYLYDESHPKDIEASFLYNCFRIFMDVCEWRTYDKMREDFPDFNNSHLHTLLRHAFYAAFHRTVNEIWNAELESRSVNLRDF